MVNSPLSLPIYFGRLIRLPYLALYALAILVTLSPSPAGAAPLTQYTCLPNGNATPLYGSNPAWTSNCPGGSGIIAGTINKDYFDAYEASDCAEYSSNTSFAIRVTAYACSGQSIRARVTAANGIVIVDQVTGTSGSVSSATSSCFESCSWPSDWSFSVLDGTAARIDIDVVCCTCQGDPPDPCGR